MPLPGSTQSTCAVPQGVWEASRRRASFNACSRHDRISLQVFIALLTFKMASPAGKDCKDPTGKVCHMKRWFGSCVVFAGCYIIAWCMSEQHMLSALCKLGSAHPTACQHVHRTATSTSRWSCTALCRRWRCSGVAASTSWAESCALASSNAVSTRGSCFHMQMLCQSGTCLQNSWSSCMQHHDCRGHRPCRSRTRLI